MSRPSTVPPEDRCGCLTKKGTECANKKGFKTNHVGTGRCYRHGGNSPGGPPGNKKALVTGEYETLHRSALLEDEKALYDSQEKIQTRQETEQEIRLASIREHRILLRIKKATLAEDDTLDGMAPTSHTRHEGWNGTGKMALSVVEYAPVADHIMRLEDALSRVQTLKARYIDLLRGILKENPADSGGLDAIVDVIDRSAIAIARAKEGMGEES